MKRAATQQGRSRVKDARGQSVTLLDPYGLQLLRRHDLIEADPLDAIVREIGPGWARRERRGFLVFWGIPFSVLAGTYMLKSLW